MQQDGRRKDALRSGIARYVFSKNYLYNNPLKLKDMKRDKGKLTEADIRARRRFWEQEGFFGTPTKEEIEKRSKKMQELLSAIKDMTYEEITAIRGTMWLRPEDEKQLIVRNADKRGLEYALQIAPKTFKVNQLDNI